MIKQTAVKTDWASLVPVDKGGFIVCAKTDGAGRCIWFDSLRQLKEALDSHRLTVKRWAVAVPGALCILKPVALPASDMAEAAKMVEFELPGLVPLPTSEIVYGCTPLKTQDNTLSVLVCIIKLKILNQLLDTYRNIAIEPHRIAFDWLAMHNWFGAVGRAAASVQTNAVMSKNRTVILSSIDHNFHGAVEPKLADSDGSQRSRQTITQIVKQQEEITAETNSKSVIVLVGAEESLSDLKDHLQALRQDSGAAGEVRLIAGPEVVRYDNGRQPPGSSYPEAVAAEGLLELAAASKLPESNLLPAGYLTRYKRKAMLFNYVVTLVMAAGLILLLWLCLAATNWRIAWACRPIESQIAPIKHISESVESKRRRVKVLQEQLSNRGQITQILKELYEHTPNNISISKLTFTPRHNGATVEINGQAEMLSDAFDYAEAMNQAALLKELQVRNAQQVPRPGGSIVEFKAFCLIKDN